MTSIVVSREVEVGPTFKPTAEASAEEEGVAVTVGHVSEGKPLVLLQVNCRSICNKVLEFWNLIDTYNPDVVIGTESWLSEEINNPEIFRDDYKLSGGIGVHRVVEYSFALKITLIAGCYGLMRFLR